MPCLSLTMGLSEVYAVSDEGYRGKLIRACSRLMKGSRGGFAQSRQTHSLVVDANDGRDERCKRLRMLKEARPGSERKSSTLKRGIWQRDARRKGTKGAREQEMRGKQEPRAANQSERSMSKRPRKVRAVARA